MRKKCIALTFLLLEKLVKKNLKVIFWHNAFEMHNNELETQRYELETQRYELETLRYELETLRYEFETQRYKLETLRYELETQRYELETLRYELEILGYEFDRQRYIIKLSHKVDKYFKLCCIFIPHRNPFISSKDLVHPNWRNSFLYKLYAIITFNLRVFSFVENNSLSKNYN